MAHAAVPHITASQHALMHTCSLYVSGGCMQHVSKVTYAPATATKACAQPASMPALPCTRRMASEPAAAALSPRRQRTSCMQAARCPALPGVQREASWLRARVLKPNQAAGGQDPSERHVTNFEPPGPTLLAALQLMHTCVRRVSSGRRAPPASGGPAVAKAVARVLLATNELYEAATSAN